MGRDPESDRLDFMNISGNWFIADEAGISRLKRDVRKRAKDFLYLRKGEDFGAVIQMVFEAFNSGQETIKLMWEAYSAAPDIDLANITLDSLLESDFVKWFAFYATISKGKELVIKDHLMMKRIFKDTVDWMKGADIKILCSPEEINTRAGLGWRALGAEIRHYINESTPGSHRYYLSEREFAFFIRQPDQSFLGFHGEERELIATLKDSFETEWDANKSPNK